MSSLVNVVVLDPTKPITMPKEYDLDKPLERQLFDSKYKFNESSLFDIPLVDGCRVFESGNATVICGENVFDVIHVLGDIVDDRLQRA